MSSAPKPMTPMQAHLYPVIIPKDQLVDGNYYAGLCRNAHIARWSSEANHFTHWRDKFGREFLEDIDYWTPDGFFDEFIPVIDLGPELPQPISIEPRGPR